MKLPLPDLLKLFSGRNLATEVKMRTLIQSLWRDAAFVKSVSNQNKSSYLYENSLATEVTYKTEWLVSTYPEKIGLFKVAAAISGKTTRTLKMVKMLLSYDYSDAGNELSQNSPIILDADIDLVLGIDETSHLFATLTGLADEPKRIFLCFERCNPTTRMGDFDPADFDSDDFFTG